MRKSCVETPRLSATRLLMTVAELACTAPDAWPVNCRFSQRRCHIVTVAGWVSEISHQLAQGRGLNGALWGRADRAVLPCGAVSELCQVRSRLNVLSRCTALRVASFCPAQLDCELYCHPLKHKRFALFYVLLLVSEGIGGKPALRVCEKHKSQLFDRGGAKVWRGRPDLSQLAQRACRALKR